MSISAQQAKELCTRDELTLVEASYPPRIGALSPAQLRQKVERARKLADKYRDLLRKQNRTAKEAMTVRMRRTNERTAQKQQLFTEARERFQERLAASAG